MKGNVTFFFRTLRSIVLTRSQFGKMEDHKNRRSSFFFPLFILQFAKKGVHLFLFFYYYCLESNYIVLDDRQIVINFISRTYSRFKYSPCSPKFSIDRHDCSFVQIVAAFWFHPTFSNDFIDRIQFDGSIVDTFIFQLFVCLSHFGCSNTDLI